MKRYLALFIFVVAPFQALAAGLPATVSNFMGRIYYVILNPIITVGFAVAILYLSWCVFQYTLNSAKFADAERVKLKDSLIYSVVGVFIMASVFGIMKFLARSITGDDSIITQNV